MAHSTWHFSGSIFVYFCLYFVFIENVNAQEKRDNWFENRPHVSMDFNLHVYGGTEECFFHYVQPESAFYVSVQVNDWNLLFKKFRSTWLYSLNIFRWFHLKKNTERSTIRVSSHKFNHLATTGSQWWRWSDWICCTAS